MFQGSQHHDEDYSLPLERLGAEHNATTDEDRTEYYERVPSNALERALWLEADRMGFLLPAMTREKLDSERDVVKNERRERVDNVPYGRADEAVREALYPTDHPYHHSVIGSMADLSAAGQGDVSAFFRTYYTPDNAILCVAGDFARRRPGAGSSAYFGPLPRGPRGVPRSRRRRLSIARSTPPDRRGQPAPRPACLADRPRRPPRRGRTRRAGRGARRPRQGEPPVPRPDVRTPARRRGGGPAPHAPAHRRVRGRRSCAPRPGPRRAGQAGRRRDRAAQAARDPPSRRSARPRTSGRAS